MEYSRDSKWVLFVCLRVICGDCLLCKGYICQHHAALMYEGCHWEQHKWAAHRCPLPLLLSQHHILMISLRLKQTLCCKSILWINSDGFCGLGCHPQCEGAEGCVVPAWSCPTTASVLHVGSNPYTCGWQIVGLLRNVLFFKMSEHEWEGTMWKKRKALSHHAVAKEADPTWSHH